MKKVYGIIERADDGTYSIYTDAEDLGYLVTASGTTVEEAKKDFESGYSDIKHSFERDNLPFTEVELVYKYDMASFLSYYSKVISLAGLSRLTGINQQQLNHYANGHRRPSPKTVEKIQKAISAFAEDLSSVRFV